MSAAFRVIVMPNAGVIPEFDREIIVQRAKKDYLGNNTMVYIPGFLIIATGPIVHRTLLLKL